MTEVGLYLKGIRKAKGITQGKVSSRLGYSTPQFISNTERGIAMPPLKTIRKVCKILKLNPMQMNELKYMLIQEYKRKVKKAFK